MKYVVYMLKGEAHQWWKTTKEVKGTEVIEALTWEQFVKLFNDHYFSISLMDKLEQDFIDI